MANRYSTPREYVRWRDPYNTELAQKALAYKQGKVDANYAQISSVIDSIAGMPIDKAESKAYLNEKLGGLIKNVNNMVGIDLSSDAVSRNIGNYLGQAVDDVVLNAYAGTMEGRKMRETIEKLKIDDPDKYSPVNEARALDPYFKWMNDGQAGSRLQPLHYTPYTNYVKEANDLMKNMYSSKKTGQTYTVPVLDSNGAYTGRMIEKTVDRMTEAEVKQVAYSMLSTNAKQQMAIDGWYMANTQPDLVTPTSVEGYVDTQNTQFDTRRNALKAQLAGANGNQELVSEIQNQLALVDSEQTSFNQTAKSVVENYNPELAGQFFVEQNFLNGIAKTWAYDRSSYKYEEDRAYYSEKNYRLKVDEAQRKSNQWKMDYDLKLKELELKDAKLSGKTGLGRATMSSQEMENMPDLPSASERIGREMTTQRSTVDSSMSALYNGLSREDREKVDAYIKEKDESQDPDYRGLTISQKRLKYFEDNGRGMNTMLSGNPDAYRAFRAASDANLQLTNNVGKLSSYNKSVDDVFNSEAANQLIGGAYQSPVIEKNGRISESRNSQLTPEEKKANILGRAYVDKIMNVDYKKLAANIGIELLGGFSPIELILRGFISRAGTEGVYMLDANTIQDSRYLAALQSLGRLNGEEITQEDVFDFDDQGNAVIKPYQVGEKYTTTMIRGQFESRNRSIFGAIANNPIIEGIDAVRGDIAALIPTNASDRIADQIFESATSKEAFEKAVDSNEVAATYNHLSASYLGNKELFQNLHDIYTSRADAKQVKGFNEKYPLQDRSYQVITFGDYSNTGKYEAGKNRIYLRTNNDPSSDVEISRDELLQKGITVDLEQHLPVTAVKDVEVDVNYLDESNINGWKLLVKEVGQQKALLASKSGIADVVRAELGNLGTQFDADGVGKDTGVMKVFRAFIDVSDGLSYNMDGYSFDGTPGLQIHFYDKNQKKSNRTPIFSLDLSGMPYADEALKTKDICPSFYLAAMLQNIAGEYVRQSITDPNAMPEKFKNMINYLQERGIQWQ